MQRERTALVFMTLSIMWLRHRRTAAKQNPYDQKIGWEACIHWIARKRLKRIPTLLQTSSAVIRLAAIGLRSTIVVADAASVGANAGSILLNVAIVIDLPAVCRERQTDQSAAPLSYGQFT